MEQDLNSIPHKSVPNMNILMNRIFSSAGNFIQFDVLNSIIKKLHSQLFQQ